MNPPGSVASIFDAVRSHAVECAKAIAIETMEAPQSIEITVHPRVYHALATEAVGRRDFGVPSSVERYFVLVDDTVRITIRQGTGR